MSSRPSRVESMSKQLLSGRVRVMKGSTVDRFRASRVASKNNGSRGKWRLVSERGGSI